MDGSFWETVGLTSTGHCSPLRNDEGSGMSGIVGIWNTDDRPVSPALLVAVDAALSHRGSDAGGQWVGGSVGLACRLVFN